MNDHVYTVTEIIGTSKTSVEDAVQHGIKTAAKNAQEPRMVRGDPDQGPYRRRRDRALPSLHEAWTSLRPEVTRRQFRISRGVPLRLHPDMVLNTIHEQSP